MLFTRRRLGTSYDSPGLTDPGPSLDQRRTAPATLLTGAVLLGVAALSAGCDQETDKTRRCQEIGEIATTGAKCAALSSPVERYRALVAPPPPSAQACAGAIYRALGLTNNDAAQIIEIGVDAFFERQRGRDFCDYVIARNALLR